MVKSINISYKRKTIVRMILKHLRCMIVFRMRKMQNGSGFTPVLTKALDVESKYTVYYHTSTSLQILHMMQRRRVDG